MYRNNKIYVWKVLVRQNKVMIFNALYKENAFKYA